MQIQDLFQNAQFILLLKDQVQHLVSQTIVKRNQTRSGSDLVEQIHTVIGRIIEMNVKEEMTSVTDEIYRSLIRVREETEREIGKMREDMKEEGEEFRKGMEERVRDMKKDMMSNSIRIDHRLSNMNRVSQNHLLPPAISLSPKLKDITNQLANTSTDDQLLPKSLKLLPFSSKVLPQLGETCSKELKVRLKEFEKTIEEIENVLVDLENRLHERYEVNIASLWTVVAEIEGKLLTEEKVESKLGELRGSMLLANQGREEEKQKERQREKAKKWYNF